MLIGNLEKTAALEADPVRVLLDLQIEGLPLLSALQVELLNQVSALASIEACHHIQR